MSSVRHRRTRDTRFRSRLRGLLGNDAADGDHLPLRHEATHHAGYHAHALFWAHLVLEKTCKGPWVSRKQEIRYPHTHSLLRLLKEAEIQIIEDQLQFFTAMNEFQSHGRYGDELERMEATVTPDLCAEFMAQTKIQMEWLIKQMHSR